MSAKAKILAAGTVDADGIARGWYFDGQDESVGFSVSEGKERIAGYTIDELRAIAAAKGTDVSKGEATLK